LSNSSSVSGILSSVESVSVSILPSLERQPDVTKIRTKRVAMAFLPCCEFPRDSCTFESIFTPESHSFLLGLATIEAANIAIEANARVNPGTDSFRSSLDSISISESDASSGDA